MDDDLMRLADMQEKHDEADARDLHADAEALHGEARETAHEADEAWKAHEAAEAAKLQQTAADLEKSAAELDHRAGLMKDAAMFARFEEADIKSRADLRKRGVDDEHRAAEMQGQLDRNEVTATDARVDLVGRIGAARGEAAELRKLDDGMTEEIVRDIHHEHERDNWAHEGYQRHPHPELGEGTPPGQPHPKP